MKYYYKDFKTGKLKYTKGKFIGYAENKLLKYNWAIFSTKSTNVLVPEYLLTKETLNILNKEI